MRIEVSMRPVGKGRPRFARVGAGVRSYTPAKTKNAEEVIALAWKSQSGEKVEGAVQLKLTAVFAPPKSISKKKQEELIGTPYEHKPDLDNIVKLVCDALNGKAWADDSTVTGMKLSKIYGREDRLIVEAERTET